MPHPKPDLPRKLLIADCFAALSPSPALWERWVTNILRLQQDGAVTEDQVHSLIYHEQAKSKLFEVTHGDPAAVDEHTVTEVLDRFESDLRRPAEQQAADERARRKAAEHAACHADKEAAGLRAELAELSARVQQHEDARRAAEHRRQRRRRLARMTTGITIATLVIATFVFCVIAGDIDGKWGWASAVTLLVLGVTAGIAVAGRLGYKFPVVAVIAVGGFSSLFVNVFSVAPDDHPVASQTRAP